MNYPSLDPLLGKTVEEARSWLRENRPKSPRHSWATLEHVRVVKSDGKVHEVTCDAVFARVNVVLEGGRIAEVSHLG